MADDAAPTPPTSRVFPDRINDTLKGYLEGEIVGLERQFADQMARMPIEKIDVHQSISIKDPPLIDDLDLLVRKLLLFHRSDIEIQPRVVERMAFYLYLREFYRDTIDLLASLGEDPDRPDLRDHLLGLASYRLSLHEKAVDHFAAAYEANPELLAAAYSLGVVYYLQGRHDDAIEMLSKLSQHYAKRANFHLAYGNALMAAGQTDRGVDHLKQYLTSHPRNAKVLASLTDFAYANHDWTPALEYALRLKEVAPEAPQAAPYRLSILFYYQGEMSRACLFLIEHLNFDRHEVSEFSEDLLFGLYLKAFELNRYDDAIFPILEALLKRDLDGSRTRALKTRLDSFNRLENPDDSVLGFIARLNMLLGNYAEAVAALERLLDRGPLDSESLQTLSKAYFKCDQTDEGMVTFGQIKDLDEADPELLYLAGVAYVNQDNLDEAVTMLDLAGERGFSSADFYGYRGFVAFRMNDVDVAIGYYRQMLAADSESLDARNNLGIALSEQGEYDEAIELFKEILEREPDHSDAHYNLSRTYRMVLERVSADHYDKYVSLSADDLEQAASEPAETTPTEESS